MQLTNNKTFALQTDLGLYCRTGINQPKTSIQEHTFITEDWFITL